MQLPNQFIKWIRGCITTSKFSLFISRGLLGYFKREKRVRQRNPLSPYFFVIAMNVLSKLLDSAVVHRVFSFHPKCKKIHLTHLSFVDDLLIFSKGNLNSIIGIKNVMDQFYLYSRLQLNSSKCELFWSRVNGGKLMEIQQATRFKLGILLVRYLGVPLVTRRLTKKDCNPLVHKITERNKHWTTKFLTYAGRYQLIQIVIYNIYNY